MKLYNFKNNERFINAILKAKGFIIKAKEPVIDFTLNTLRHYVKRMKGKSNV
jgi:hypothetical protein